MVDGIVKSFSELLDPRRPGRVQHKLIDILVIAVSADIDCQLRRYEEGLARYLPGFERWRSLA